MSVSLRPGLSHEVPAPPLSTALLPVFATAILVSAALLFSVQPMFAKMVLPTLGGAPAVWSVAMVFFQALLLAGYAYAHWLAGLPAGRALTVHLALMAVAALFLPIGLPEGWGRPPADGEALWLLGLFAVAVGPPFLALAANGPLLQAWFSRSGHAQARDPYFLYAASNVGSFAALLAYPLVAEPLLALRQQTAAWAGGFALLAVLIAWCGVRTARAGGGGAAAAARRPAGRTTWGERLAWTGLSFVPSGLLVAVTSHISTDVAAAPLLWVVPLALFLLTFVLAFRERPLVPPGALATAQVYGTAAALISPILPLGMMGLPLHLGTFLASALVCHAALYARRPEAGRLTEFYMFMSLGGVLGGAFCSLGAPLIFPTVTEYPLLLAAALACRPGFLAGPAGAWLRQAAVAAAGIVVALALVLAALWALSAAGRGWVVAMAACGGAMLLFRSRPPRLAAAVLCLAAVAAAPGLLAEGRFTVRSFFGVHKIATSADGLFRTLGHGTTIHGAVRLGPDAAPAPGRPEPTTYYTFDGPIGRAIAEVRAARGGLLPPVGVVGLGAGTLACHAVAGEDWTFFEIDPEVVRLARDPGLFGFLPACLPGGRVVLGDARISLADDPGGRGVLVVDAFSSDAIPAHLVTREAIGLYLAKLDARGVVVIHVSNRHMNLSRILARTAAEHGLQAFEGLDATEEPQERRFRTPSQVVVLARDPAHLGSLAADPAWRHLPPDPARRPWTDDFSNIVQAIRDK